MRSRGKLHYSNKCEDRRGCTASSENGGRDCEPRNRGSLKKTEKGKKTDSPLRVSVGTSPMDTLILALRNRF